MTIEEKIVEMFWENKDELFKENSHSVKGRMIQSKIDILAELVRFGKIDLKKKGKK